MLRPKTRGATGTPHEEAAGHPRQTGPALPLAQGGLRLTSDENRAHVTVLGDQPDMLTPAPLHNLGEHRERLGFQLFTFG